ncbi:hypothetical protein GJQ54_13950 [Oceanospirillaceae bacterium ASx5O]|nr:hypothetical protein GJQ54_13950 [Oceanospirillaceae bacterium ASx5O]
MAQVSSRIGAEDIPAIEKLKKFLDQLCGRSQGNEWIRQLSRSTTRWVSVADTLSEKDSLELNRIAFESRSGGFSACNLKVHYVLDEDFINGGTAILLFALVGSDWTYVVRVNEQNLITPASVWLTGES